MTTTTTVPAGLVDLVVARPLNPPAHVTLRPEHLPADIARAFAALQDALVRERETRLAADTARGDQEQAGLAADARTATDRALDGLARLTAGSGTALQDSAGAAFTNAVDRALAALREAEERIEEAQHAVALHRRVAPGRPVLNLNLDGRGLRDHAGWQRLSMARQNVRDAVAHVREAGL
ncbi:hypothetical protein ACFCX4_08960 [Kitasatospora sp. NPDC056327]|uniref:hypothetical protein n=1 Tax=Kitasatospora sp. NPDC056327 TaxID=3345785 RepID=UPI0035DBB6B9